jgi:hypothetical protein
LLPEPLAFLAEALALAGFLSFWTGFALVFFVGLSDDESELEDERDDETGASDSEEVTSDEARVFFAFFFFLGALVGTALCFLATGERELLKFVEGPNDSDTESALRLGDLSRPMSTIVCLYNDTINNRNSPATIVGRRIGPRPF